LIKVLFFEVGAAAQTAEQVIGCHRFNEMSSLMMIGKGD
jgi:hypothetical protein